MIPIFPSDIKYFPKMNYQVVLHTQSISRSQKHQSAWGRGMQWIWVKKNVE